MIRAIFLTELANFRRDRAAVAMSFVLPIVFFTIFAIVFAGAIDNASRKVPIAVVDLDGSELSRKFIRALADESALEVTTIARTSQPQAPFTEESAQEAVRRGDVPVALFIPRGFGAALFDFSENRRPVLHLLTDSSDPVAAGLATGMVQKVLGTSMPDETMAAGIELFRGWTGGLSEEQERTLAMNIDSMKELQKSSPSTQPAGLVSVVTRDVVGGEKENPVVAFYAAAIGVMFLLLSSSRAGGSLIDEADAGTLDRVLSTRVSMTGLLTGKLLFLSAVGFVQLCVMFVWGAIVFRLDLLSNLPGFFLLAAATSLASSAFGLLLATACRSRAQLYAVSTLLILIISAVGGSMFPRFLMPESVLRVSLVFFNSWALEGFLKVFWREAPLLHIWPELVVLLATAALFLFIARQLARRWEYS